MADQQNPSTKIAEVGGPLPQAGSEPQVTRKRTYTKRRRKKYTKNSVPAIPASDEEPTPRIFLTAVANLTLLVAVLTIVFAAHRAVQNNKQQTTEQIIDNRPLTIDQTAQATEPASAPQVTPNPSEPTEPTQQAELVETAQPQPKAGPPLAETEQPEPPPKAHQAETKAKQAKPIDRFSSVPYTNGGALDLDRKLPSARSNTVSNQKNPWNSGGSSDLDSETSRQQYKKALSLAE